MNEEDLKAIEKIIKKLDIFFSKEYDIIIPERKKEVYIEDDIHLARGNSEENYIRKVLKKKLSILINTQIFSIYYDKVFKNIYPLLINYKNGTFEKFLIEEIIMVEDNINIYFEKELYKLEITNDKIPIKIDNCMVSFKIKELNNIDIDENSILIFILEKIGYHNVINKNIRSDIKVKYQDKRLSIHFDMVDICTLSSNNRSVISDEGKIVEASFVYSLKIKKLII